MLETGVAVAGLTLLLFLLAWRLVRWMRAQRPAGAAGEAPGHASTPVEAADAGPPEAAARQLERRMEEIEAIQADLAERLGTLDGAAGATRLQALAGSLLDLMRDKSATLETALAGLDGLRDRLKTLEAIGGIAQARQLSDGPKGRLETLEAKVAALEGRMDPATALARVGERLSAAEAVQAGFESRVEARLATIERPMTDPMADPVTDPVADPVADPLAGLAAGIERLRDHLDAATEALKERGAVEARTLGEAAARAEDQAADARMIAARRVAEETRRFADRLSLLEASLPRLTLARSRMMQLLEQEGAQGPRAETDPAPLRSVPAPVPPVLPPVVSPVLPPVVSPVASPGAGEAATADLAEIWRNPRVISLHQSK